MPTDLRRRAKRPTCPPLLGSSLLTSDPAALAELRRTEVKFANADVACEEKHIVPVEDVVQAEKEKEFRDANADLLGTVKPLGE